jgi:hypothetical protein
MTMTPPLEPWQHDCRRTAAVLCSVIEGKAVRGKRNRFSRVSERGCGSLRVGRCVGAF